MTISVYEQSVPVFSRMLSNLSAILVKAETYAEARKIEPSVLLGARLYPDMFPLTRQVQIASDHAKGASARLAGVEVPKWEDKEATFTELGERIDRTLTFLKQVKPSQFEGAEARSIELKLPSRTLSFSGKDYLLGYALPNFYFHVGMAYAILRHNGLEVGKKDFLG